STSWRASDSPSTSTTTRTWRDSSSRESSSRMDNRLQQRITEVSRLQAADFPELALLGFDSRPLELPMPRGPVRSLRVELPHRQFLHLHSLALFDDAGMELDVRLGKISLSSVHGHGDPDLTRKLLFQTSGKHDIAFHTKDDQGPWLVVE